LLQTVPLIDKFNFYTDYFNEKCFSAFSAIWPPIAKEAVAAGEGAFKTWIE
jgi:hypothetical protein